MFLLKKEHILQIMENLLYFALLGLGIYFIYIGDVIPKFWLGRTNFAEYQEVMTELPTISTYIINVPKNFTMGKDFYLSLNGKTMEFGINDIQGLVTDSSLKVNVQHVLPEQFSTRSGKWVHWLQIKPLNFPAEMPHNLALEYRFVSTLHESQIGMYLTPQNASFDCAGSNLDAEKITTLVKIGEAIIMKIQPIKILYLQKSCRETPYFNLVQNVETDHYYGKLCREARTLSVQSESF